MHLKPVASWAVVPTAAQARHAQGVPKGGASLPLGALLISYGKIINSLDVAGLADVLDGGNETFCSGIQQVLGQGSVVGLAPFGGFQVFGAGETGGFAERDEPDGELGVGDAVEDAVELAAIVLPYRRRGNGSVSGSQSCVCLNLRIMIGGGGGRGVRKGKGKVSFRNGTAAAGHTYSCG